MTRAFILLLVLSLGQSARAGPDPAQLVKVDFVFDNKITHTLDLPTLDLQTARKSMVTGQKVSSDQLRALADAGDGLAAYRYAKLLQASAKPAKTGAAAHYYAIAAYTGRAFAVGPLAKLLVAEGESYGPKLLKQCKNALTIQAMSGNAHAAQALGQMYSTGAPFGRDLPQAQHFLAMAGQSDPAAAMKLALVLLSDPTDAALDHAGARAALTLAAQGTTSLSAKVTALNLLHLLDKPATLATKDAP